MSYDLPNFKNADQLQGRSGNAPIVTLADTLNVEAIVKARGLLPCDDWNAADWRFPTQIHDLACNVEITGRVAQKRGGAYWKRAEITFVGDGEPNKVVRGFVRVA